MYLEKLKEMFNEVTIKKNADCIADYYHKDFLCYTNEQIINFENFVSSHREYYKTPIQYTVEYDEETIVEQGEKVACRLWITVIMPNETPKKLELILIAQYKDGKIYRLWELSFPDWSKLEFFDK